MKRRTLLLAAVAFAAGCAPIQPEPEPEPFIYGSNTNSGGRRVRMVHPRSQRQPDPFRETEQATRSIDTIMRRVQRWSRS